MQREIIQITDPGSCCPGHDKYPREAYNSHKSVKKLSISKGKEHRHARRCNKQNIVIPDIYDVLYEDESILQELFTDRIKFIRFNSDLEYINYLNINEFINVERRNLNDIEHPINNRNKL